MITEVKIDSILYAIIIPSDFSESGVHFLTDGSFSQQLAFMKHPTGKLIQSHVHNKVKREVIYTQEVLFIRKGKIRVDFFKNNYEYLESYILKTGDVILLSSGGHGFEILEETEMIEVKQGPYSGDKDKTRFSPSKFELKIINDSR